MISHLKGRLVEKTPPYVVLDVHGVGYEMMVPMTAFYELPEVGGEVSLLTHLAIREDAHVLYGFVDNLTRQLFRVLIKVNGVGPKLALAILSGMDTATLLHTIEHRDSIKLTKIPGVGKKTAERLVIELRDKVQSLLGISETVPNNIGIQDDAISALVALGYKPTDASRVVKSLEKQADTRESLIRLALQQMVG